MVTHNTGSVFGDKISDISGNVAHVRTLADLARLAGVSTGTVSRALAGKSLVNPETRARIQTLAREHDFRPNQMASKLRSQRTGVIGVIIPLGHEKRQQISDPFFLTLLGCLADELTESGYDLMLSRAIPDGTSEWLDRVTRSGMVDGVLIVGQSDQFEVIETISRQYRPLVCWGAFREGQNHHVVGTDNFAGGRIAAEHLIASGARKLAFCGDTHAIEIALRENGAKDAAGRAGVEIIHIPVSLACTEMGPQIKTAMAQISQGIDGIIAASDMIAMKVLSCLYEADLRVPQDIQVIGFDDLPMAALTFPPLSTIRQEITAGATSMVERLKLLIEGEQADSMITPPQLIVRESTRLP